MRSIAMLAVGLGLGALLGVQVHAAAQAGAPCLTPGPFPPVPKGHLLATYDGKVPGKEAMFPGDQGNVFTYRGSITVTFTGTQVDKTKITNGVAFIQSEITTKTNEVGQIAIAPGDVPSQTIKLTTTLKENDCKFGCRLSIIDGQNIAWHITATK